MSSEMSRAVILLAHGTKEVNASKPVFEYARALSDEFGLRVEGCLREFIEPSIPTVVKQMAAGGVKKIYVVPFFLFKSGHVTRDIESDIDQERAKYPPAYHFHIRLLDL